MALDMVVLGIAFSAGVATFFSPCGIALIPAYAGYFLGLDDREEALQTPFRATVDGAKFGGAAAFGALSLFATGGGLAFLVQQQIQVPSALVGSAVEYAALGVGVLIIGFGVLMMGSRLPGFTPSVKLPTREKSFKGMAGFGVVFGVGSMGCTLPLFVSVAVQAFTQGPLGVLASFLAYGAGLGVMMLGTGVAMSVAKEETHAHMRRITPYVKPASGLIMVAAGGYVVYYYTVLVPGGPL